jgi:photosystem II stability/assembly factor-like uncharacterized protein
LCNVPPGGILSEDPARAIAAMLGRAILFAATLIAIPPTAAGAEQSAAVAPGPQFTAARQPQVAVGPNGTVHVTFGVGNAIYCANSTDGGRTFAPPVKVGEAGKLALGMRRGPRVTATRSAVTVVASCGERGGGKDGDTLAWRSTDGGRTWAAPVKINRAAGWSREGLHDLVAGPNGRLFCVWIDLRNGRPQLFGATSADGGATWDEDRIVYEGPLCPCCQPSACFDSKNRLHVLWRNNIADDRDMYLISSADGGRTWDPARKLGQGTWHLRACPMDGGGLAVDEFDTVHTIWRREKTIFRCDDGGPEVSLGIGEQGRAARGPDGVFLTWIAARPGTLFVLPPKAERPRRLAAKAADPAIASAAEGGGPVVIVWEEPNAAGGSIRALTLTP